LSNIGKIEMTNEILEKYGFHFKKLSGISGADMWQGMDSWFHEDAPDLYLRGNINKKTGEAYVVLAGHINSQIRTEQDIIDLFRILNIRWDIK